MFIEADARMDTYEDKDGIKRTQINLLMRKCRRDGRVHHPGRDA